MSQRRDRVSPRTAEPQRRATTGRALLAVGGPAVGVVGALLSTLVAAEAGERRIVVGADRRAPIEAVAMGGVERYAATGVIECGGMRGIGQLTGAADVVTTAAHVLFDEQGRSRAAAGVCRFVVDGPAGRTAVAIEPDPRTCGSTSPYAVHGRHDWAAARLERPIVGVRPYGLGGTARPGDRIVVVAVEGGAKTAEICRVRDVAVGEGGQAEIRTDCVGFDGLSGAAYLTAGAQPRILGVHVGFRSATPDTAAAYSDRHHTFGSAIGAGLRKVLASAGRRV